MDDSVNQFLKRYVRSRLTRLKIIDEKLGVADLQFSLEFGLSSRSIFYAALALQMVQDATLEEIQSVNLLRGQVQDYLASELDKVVNKSESTKGMALASWPDYLGRGGSTVSLVAKVLHNDHRLNEDLLGKVREFLIAQFNGENFGSTFETGQILMNSIWLLKWEQEKRRLGRPPVVNVDGNPIDSQQQKAILAGWELNLDPTLVEQGVHDMSVQLNYPKDKAYLVGFRSVPLSKSTKPVEGMGSYLRRKIYRLNESSQQLTELGEGSILNIGDLIYIENRIRPNLNINSGSSAYYLLENDIPSGTTLVQDDSRFDRLAVYSETSGWVKREESQGRLNYYFDFSSNRGINLENQEKVGFVLRVNYAGRFYTGVSRFMDFYDESHFSQSGSFAFRVEPDPHR